MVKGRKQRNQGITLVALIITIIILIILSAVTINAVFDLNILDVAQRGAEEYAEGQYKEKEEFEKLNEMLKKGIIIENLPENTEKVEAGTLVAVPEKWKNKTQIYELKEDGAEIIKTSMNASVYAVSSRKWGNNTCTIWFLLCRRKPIKWSNNIR